MISEVYLVEALAMLWKKSCFAASVKAHGSKIVFIHGHALKTWVMIIKLPEMLKNSKG